MTPAPRGPAPTLAPHCVALGRGALTHLRDSLTRDHGAEAAARLQEAGASAGADLYHCFVAWLPSHAGVQGPEELEAARLSEVLSAFYEHMGWGSLTMDTLGDVVLAFDSPDWAEATPGAGLGAPSCFFTSGLLTTFLSALSGEPVAVMEVECRSKDDRRCRFLSGAPETLQDLYEQLLQGTAYQQALGL